MPLTTYMPRDRKRHERHPESQRFSATLEPGEYVYVQASDGQAIENQVLSVAGPDGPTDDWSLLVIVVEGE
jgi:hypothetical protein